jgi:hypothetical protein
MMICPLSVFEELKDKPEKEIRTAIRGYKNQIGRLKKILENPNFEEVMCPSHELQLQMNREYLQNAIMALISAGFEYQPSKSEEKSELFNERLDDLMQIEFNIGGFFEGHERYIIKFNETDDALFTYDVGFSSDSEAVRKTISKQECIKELKDLYMGEWKLRYWADVLDGTQWEVKLWFYNNNQKLFHGSNAFPFSFDKLKELFEMWAMESEIE